MDQRIFIGAAPENWHKEQIKRLQGSLSTTLPHECRAVKVNNLHMTLAFLGLSSSEQLSALCDSLDKLTKPKFEVTFDNLTLWRKPQVLCISGKSHDARLHHLYQGCQRIARQLKLHTNEHEFVPHITLFRKAKLCPEHEIVPITLAPNQIHLYHSVSTEQGVRYDILKSWSLE